MSISTSVVNCSRPGSAGNRRLGVQRLTSAQLYLESSLRHWQDMREPPSSAATATALAGFGHPAD
jgi:hypothetical protein